MHRKDLASLDRVGKQPSFSFHRLRGSPGWQCILRVELVNQNQNQKSFNVPQTGKFTAVSGYYKSKSNNKIDNIK